MDKWTDRLSEYLDDELTATEAEALEAHLLECPECGQTLQQLRAVVFRASQVIDRPPENDLWQGIAARIAPPASAVAVAVPRQRLTFAFSIPQLAAASIVLMLLSGGSMYLMLQRVPGLQPNRATPLAAVPAQSTPPAATPAGTLAATPAANAPAQTTRELVRHPARAASPAQGNYDVAINELEAALRDGRTRLDTTTVRVLETNLRTIDTAISEARVALGRDPGNPYLNRYLDETMQKKIQLLRRATGILRAQT